MKIYGKSAKITGGFGTAFSFISVIRWFYLNFPINLKTADTIMIPKAQSFEDSVDSVC